MSVDTTYTPYTGYFQGLVRVPPCEALKLEKGKSSTSLRETLENATILPQPWYSKDSLRACSARDHCVRSLTISLADKRRNSPHRAMDMTMQPRGNNFPAGEESVCFCHMTLVRGSSWGSPSLSQPSTQTPVSCTQELNPTSPHPEYTIPPRKRQRQR